MSLWLRETALPLQDCALRYEPDQAAAAEASAQAVAAAVLVGSLQTRLLPNDPSMVRSPLHYSLLIHAWTCMMHALSAVNRLCAVRMLHLTIPVHVPPRPAERAAARHQRLRS